VTIALHKFTFTIPYHTTSKSSHSISSGRPLQAQVIPEIWLMIASWNSLTNSIYIYTMHVQLCWLLYRRNTKWTSTKQLNVAPVASTGLADKNAQQN